jgi:hypothetical protein
MTLMLLEDALPEEEQLAQLGNPTVKCGWCGELIRRRRRTGPGNLSACYTRMLAEYELALKLITTSLSDADAAAN